MALAKEREALVLSVARFIAGLKPKRAPTARVHRFEMYGRRVVERVYELKRLAAGLSCPFCNKRFRRISGFVYHIVKVHRADVEEFLGLT